MTPNQSLQRTIVPPPAFAAAKAGVASNTAELKRWVSLNRGRVIRMFYRGVAIVCLLATSHAAGAPPTLIVATDDGLEAPKTILPGLRHIVFENRGKEIHEAMLLKLPAGMSVDGFRAKVQEGILFPDGTLDYSGPGLTSGGETTELWLTVDPGEYVLICWNHMRTSVRGFTVPERARIDDKAPREDAVLVMRDFKFELRGSLKKGARVIKVEMHGPSIHEADLFRLRPGHTAADVQRWYKGGLEDPAPADALGGVLDSHDVKRVAWLRRDFVPGRYVFHCGVPMNLKAKSGEHSPLHADAGMVMTFDVAE